MFLKAIDNSDLELLKKTTLENSIDVNGKMPGMKKSLIQDALENNENFALQLIKHSKDLEIDLNTKHELTPLMMSCDLALPRIVEELFRQKVDCNIVTDGIRQSAFHMACQSKAKQKKEVVDLFVSNADLLHIDLDAEDYFGKSGWDYYLESWWLIVSQLFICIVEAQKAFIAFFIKRNWQNKIWTLFGHIVHFKNSMFFSKVNNILKSYTSAKR